MKHGNKSRWMHTFSGNSMNKTAIDYTKAIIPLLWKFLDKCRRPCFVSLNVYMSDNEWIISIIDNRKIRRFKSSENPNLIENISAYLKVS